MSEFHKDRRGGIGGSDVPPLVGMDPYGRTSLDIWREKTGRIVQDDSEIKSPWLDRGIRLEPVVREMFAERMDLRVQKAQFQRNKRWHWMIGHPDGLVYKPTVRTRKPIGILEIKHAALKMFSQVKTEGIPWHWQLQWQHYAMLTGIKKGWFAVLNAERWEMLVVEMKADQKMWDALHSIERTFWEENVEKDIAPVPQKAEVPEVQEETMGLDVTAVTKVTSDEWNVAVQQHRDAADLEETVKYLKKQAREDLIALMPEHGVYQGGGAKVYFGQSPGRKTFDFKTLEKLKPLDPVTVGLILGSYNDPLMAEAANRIGAEAVMNLEPLKKIGDPYDTVRVYPLREEENDVGPEDSSS